MSVLRSLFVACCVLWTVSTGASDAPDRTTETPPTLAQEENVADLFHMCCWARGRAGFHYCEEYGVCESDPEATCKGVGSAEGRTLSCKSEPPAENGQGS